MFDYQDYSLDNCFDHNCCDDYGDNDHDYDDVSDYRHDANGDDNMKMVPISEKWSAEEGVECLANSSLRHFD